MSKVTIERDLTAIEWAVAWRAAELQERGPLALDAFVDIAQLVEIRPALRTLRTHRLIEGHNLDGERRWTLV